MIRRRLTVAVVAIITAIGGLVAVGFLAALDSRLVDAVDHELERIPDAALTNARRALLAAGLVALADVAGATWLVIRRGLRPIDRMVDTAQAIAAGNISERIHVAGPASEVGRLGRALNRMLDRIAEALAARTASEQRMRRFVADASHELRTPLTAIRGYAELYRRSADDPVAVATAMDRIEHAATRMGGLVDDLVLLARLDEGRPLDARPVDLARLVAGAVTDARAIEPDPQDVIDELTARATQRITKVVNGDTVRQHC
jgi:two-component system OmpR family sensor kinase